MPEVLEPVLRDFFGDHVSQVRSVSFVGWDHAESRVWKIETVSDVFFLKAHRQIRKFRQERFAYENWVPHLPAVTPRLIAVRNESPTALLMTGVRGRVAELVELTEAQRLQLHCEAGKFLKAMHALPHIDHDIPVADAFQQRLDSWIVRARGHLEPSEIHWVQLQVTDALPNLGSETRVPCHRDFTPRNWLINKKHQMSVIDFEHSRPDLWFMDIERLWSRQWLEWPECADAFWEGYGRVLTDAELQTLAQCATLSAMSTIVWAREHSDAQFEAEGRRSFIRLQELL